MACSETCTKSIRCCGEKEVEVEEKPKIRTKRNAFRQQNGKANYPTGYFPHTRSPKCDCEISGMFLPRCLHVRRVTAGDFSTPSGRHGTRECREYDTASPTAPPTPRLSQHRCFRTDKKMFTEKLRRAIVLRAL